MHCGRWRADLPSSAGGESEGTEKKQNNQQNVGSEFVSYCTEVMCFSHNMHNLLFVHSRNNLIFNIWYQRAAHIYAQSGSEINTCQAPNAGSFSVNLTKLSATLVGKCCTIIITLTRKYWSRCWQARYAKMYLAAVCVRVRHKQAKGTWCIQVQLVNSEIYMALYGKVIGQQQGCHSIFNRVV